MVKRNGLPCESKFSLTQQPTVSVPTLNGEGFYTNWHVEEIARRPVEGGQDEEQD